MYAWLIHKFGNSNIRQYPEKYYLKNPVTFVINVLWLAFGILRVLAAEFLRQCTGFESNKHSQNPTTTFQGKTAMP